MLLNSLKISKQSGPPSSERINKSVELVVRPLIRAGVSPENIREARERARRAIREGTKFTEPPPPLLRPGLSPQEKLSNRIRKKREQIERLEANPALSRGFRHTTDELAKYQRELDALLQERALGLLETGPGGGPRPINNLRRR